MEGHVESIFHCINEIIFCCYVYWRTLYFMVTERKDTINTSVGPLYTVCVLMYAYISSPPCDGVRVRVRERASVLCHLFYLHTGSSISAEHLEVIAGLCWTCWLVPILIMDGYYCLLAVSQIKAICPRTEAYRAKEGTFSFWRRRGDIWISHLNNRPRFTNLLARSRDVSACPVMSYKLEQCVMWCSCVSGKKFTLHDVNS